MIFRSLLPNVEIPRQPLHEFVLARAGEIADREAIIDGPSGRGLSYHELLDQTRRAAAALAEQGFQKGDCLALYSPNLPEYAVVFLAVASLGGHTTPVNPLSTGSEMAAQLRDSGARFAVTTPSLLENLLEVQAGTGVERIHVFGEADAAGSFSDLLQAGSTPPALEIDPGQTLVALPYSSGTTGLPKGVMLTHRNLVANLCQLLPTEGGSSKDRVIAFLPFFHIYGMVAIMLLGLCRGLTIVSMPRFELESFLKIIETYRITRAYLVPPVVLALAEHPLVDRYDLSSLRMLFCAAAPLPAEVGEACAERLGCPIKQGYGMTEASPATHMSPEEPERIKSGSVGVLVPNLECRVADPVSGADCEVNRTGELWVRGPNVMKGYLNAPADEPPAPDEEGWLHSGDLGYVDEHGYFYIVDRSKELIKYKGYQVAPAELEAVILKHPDVVDAAVIPSPDAEAGEVPKAFVVVRSSADAEGICDFVARRVAPHKKVRRIEIIDEIPRSATGKILRRVLVERERAAPGQSRLS